MLSRHLVLGRPLGRFSMGANFFITLWKRNTFSEIEVLKWSWTKLDSVSTTNILQMLYYSFAIIGMESFGGKIKYVNGTDPELNTCGNPALAQSEFARMNYCKNNFNDILRSLVILVELTVVNQWHDILYFVLTTANWYFCTISCESRKWVLLHYFTYGKTD